MDDDLLDLYERSSEWAATKVAGAADRLDAPTTCDDWDVRALLNHIIDTQHYFAGSARGEDAAPPSAPPPELLSDDVVADFRAARDATIRAFSEPGITEKSGISLGIASSDMLLHGWDLAASTKQDTTMPSGLPRVVYDMIHGRFTEEQRKGIFKPELPVPADASDQDRLLAYTGRDPAKTRS